MSSVARGYLVYDITSSPILLGLVNAGFIILIVIGAMPGSLFMASIGHGKRGILLTAGGTLSGAGLIIAGFILIISVVSVTLFFLGIGDLFRKSLSMAMIMELTDP